MGKKVLILGDVRTGKTRLTTFFLQEAINLGFITEITVIDMAPKTTVVGDLILGGRLFEKSKIPKGLRYLSPRCVYTPRLSSRCARELLELVEKNRRRILPLLRSYLSKPTPILFANDLSIYLQSGDMMTIQRVVQTASTFVGNGYFGTTLMGDFNTGVSQMERELMERLAATMDIRIRLESKRLGNASDLKGEDIISNGIGYSTLKATLSEAMLAYMRKPKGAFYSSHRS
ncbi:MAG: hypothetical protein QXF26_02270 [Candidatus Bathyarchaeia archaeon]